MFATVIQNNTLFRAFHFKKCWPEVWKLSFKEPICSNITVFLTSVTMCNLTSIAHNHAMFQPLYAWWYAGWSVSRLIRLLYLESSISMASIDIFHQADHNHTCSFPFSLKSIDVLKWLKLILAQNIIVFGCGSGLGLLLQL